MELNALRLLQGFDPAFIDSRYSLRTTARHFAALTADRRLPGAPSPSMKKLKCKGM